MESKCLLRSEKYVSCLFCSQVLFNEIWEPLLAINFSALVKEREKIIIIFFFILFPLFYHDLGIQVFMLLESA